MTLLLKTLKNIKEHPWESIHNEINDMNLSQIVWDYSKPATLSDVVLWEELYFRQGDVGIYAAYSPYIEYYIIVFNLFANINEGIEEFYGAGSNKKVWERAKKLGIELATEKTWIPKKELHLYEPLD